MKENLLGHIIDIDGLELEVWGVFDSEQALHHTISLNFEASQCGTFSYGQAGSNELYLLAERLARGEANRLAVMGYTPNESNEQGSLIDEWETAELAQAWRAYHGNTTLH